MTSADETPALPRTLGALDCAYQGAVQLLIVLAILSAVFAVEIVQLAPPSASRNVLWFKEVWEALGQAAVIIIPPVLGIVALVARDSYRLATRQRQPVHTNMWALGVALLVLVALNVYVIFVILPFIPFLLQRFRRRKLFSAAPTADWILPSAYALLFAGMGMLLGDSPPRTLLDAVPEVMLVCYFGVLIQDCVMVDRMAHFRAQGRLKVVREKTFQFSLGAMLTVVIALAAYVTGLVMIFR